MVPIPAPAPPVITGYAYPWDIVGDPDAAARLSAIGIHDVTLAAAYHSVRAATPRHPLHRLVETEAAMYLRVRERAWGRLRPGDGGDTFRVARDSLAARGIRTRAWVVATHSTAVGSVAAELCVRNAFGDVYPYALCPSSAEVRDYAATLVSEVSEQAGVDAMAVEACGPLGVSHQGRHEKTAGADWTATDEALLSICFCVACAHQYGDAESIRRRIRDAVGRGADSVVSVLETDAAAVLAVRSSAVKGLRAGIEAAAAGIAELAFFASSDPWATGPMAPLLGPDTAGADRVIVDAWADASESLDRIRVAAHPGRSVGAYCTVLPPTHADAPSLARHWAACESAGASAIHLYHLGLASDQRLDAVGEALAIFRGAQRHHPESTAGARS